MSDFKDIVAKETPAAEKRPEVEQKKSDVSVPCLPKEASKIHPQKPDKNLYHSVLKRLGLSGNNNIETSLAGRRQETSASSDRYEKVAQYCEGKAAEAWDRFQKTGDTGGKDYQEYKSYQEKFDCLVREKEDIAKSVRPAEGLIEAAEADESKVSGCPIEGHNGSWDGFRGNAMWRPDRKAIPSRYNPNGLTWGQILDKYGIEGTEYKDGDPDFSSISKSKVEIDDFTDQRPLNFLQADESLAKQRGCSPEEVKKWREENGYTWHECRDCKTMQKVPREIHNNMDHSGGVSEYKRARIQKEEHNE